MRPLKKKQRLYLDECIKRLQLEKDILGIIVIDSIDGNPIKSIGIDEQLTLQYCGHFGQLMDKAKLIVNQNLMMNKQSKSADDDDDDYNRPDQFICLRVRSKKHEVIIQPDNEFIFLIIQNPTGY